LRMYKMNRSFPRGDSKCCLSSKLLLSHLSEKTTSIILFRHLWLVSTAVLQNMGEHERRKSAPSGLASCIDSHTAPETLRLVERAGIAKAHLSWADLATKSFLAGIFISLGAGFDLVLAGGAPELRASNPSLATLIGAFVFPTGFVVIMLTNMKLCTSAKIVRCYTS
jgi:hypothetical protein